MTAGEKTFISYCAYPYKSNLDKNRGSLKHYILKRTLINSDTDCTICPAAYTNVLNSDLTLQKIEKTN